MAFERYVRGGRTYKPMASIWSRGQISLNKGAVQRFKAENYKFAILFYDTETERIGLKFTNDEDEKGATAITMGKTGAIISAVSFLDFYDIDHSTTRRYPIAYDEDAGLYVITLKSDMEATKDEGR